MRKAEVEKIASQIFGYGFVEIGREMAEMEYGENREKFEKVSCLLVDKIVGMFFNLGYGEAEKIDGPEMNEILVKIEWTNVRFASRIRTAFERKLPDIVSQWDFQKIGSWQKVIRDRCPELYNRIHKMLLEKIVDRLEKITGFEGKESAYREIAEINLDYGNLVWCEYCARSYYRDMVRLAYSPEEVFYILNRTAEYDKPQAVRILEMFMNKEQLQPLR